MPPPGQQCENRLGLYSVIVRLVLCSCSSGMHNTIHAMLPAYEELLNEHSITAYSAQRFGKDNNLNVCSPCYGACDCCGLRYQRATRQRFPNSATCCEYQHGARIPLVSVLPPAPRWRSSRFTERMMNVRHDLFFSLWLAGGESFARCCWHSRRADTALWA